MSVRVETQAEVASSLVPSFTSVQSGLPQRKCACGACDRIAGPEGEYAECRGKRPTVQRRAANQAVPTTVPLIDCINARRIADHDWCRVPPACSDDLGRGKSL